MKKFKNNILLCMIVILSVLPLHAMAKEATVVKTSKPANVTKAPKLAGEWEGTQFKKADEKIVKNKWFKTEDGIFYVDKSGNKVTGLIQYKKKLYYANEKGLIKGWKKTGKKFYYFTEDYFAASGLTAVDGSNYYLDPDTFARNTGWIKIGKHRYYFAPSGGAMVKNSWVKNGNGYSYVNAKGRMKKSSWLTLDDGKYYVDSDGLRVTGENYIKGKWYYFSEDGIYDSTKKISNAIDPKKKMVAITYDDGPGPYTERLLKCLENNKARATFFMVGQSVPNYKNAVKKMAKLGCELGNHTYSHENLQSLSDGSIQSQMSKTNNAIYSVTGKYPTVMRLPYGSGSSNSRVLNAVGLPSIYWSIDTRDWANTGNSAHTVNEVLNHVQDGDIVLMHDIHNATVTASETIIPALIKRGYQLVTVSELAKYRGKTQLRKGTTYYSFK